MCVYMCLCMYIYVFMHLYTYAHICIRICGSTETLTYINKYVSVVREYVYFSHIKGMYVCIYVFMYVYIRVYACVHICTHLYSYTHVPRYKKQNLHKAHSSFRRLPLRGTHTQTHTHTQTYTHTQTHTHAHTRARALMHTNRAYNSLGRFPFRANRKRPTDAVRCTR
jgi:hypothetical protein